MEKCPVCGKQNHSLSCDQCGFDGSMDYERYPTFCAISAPSLQSYRMKYQQAGRHLLTTPKKPGGPTIAAGGMHTVAVRKDGRVLVAGSKFFDCCRLSKWRNIVSVAAGYAHTVGLRCDGTLVASGSNGYGECNVSEWTNIVAIAAGPYHTVGLKADGTVVATGLNGDHLCDVGNWSQIVAICASANHTVGLRADGTVVELHRRSRVKKIVQGPSGYKLADMEDDVSDWKEIVAIASTSLAIYGIRRDGTVITNNTSRFSTSQKNIKAIAGALHTMLLHTGGTVSASGENHFGQCDVSHWRNIVSIDTSDRHTVGLRSDGTVVTAGSREYGRHRVFHWKNILIP